MKKKYVMIRGLAFSEEDDMEKLKNYASQGWILEDIVVGIFYKLRKDKPQNIVYNLDYQTETNEEYFTMFKEAGWKLVVSIENYMHIFSAQVGTKPIYSDCESEIDKYTSIRNTTRKGTLYSLIIAIALMGLLVVSLMVIKPIFLIILGLLIIDIFIFVFNFMPYLAYNSRIKQIKKYGKCNSKTIDNKISWKLYGIAGVLWLAIGIWHLIGELYFSSVFFIIFGAFFIFLSSSYFKKYKKSL
ncbi:DUF2812 domain-containing protein [Clostridium septicum]|uniref:DUF2812 domain-containing protein n=1 Tax=Clostridium septicum TaxID=1504 RepID=A0A9N7PIM7_CLOSE|nr:DUF2812 domain-containing protein [Clostridium septicum]AYE33825.1 hypothetical protein CP523_04725 [Clostridium septicum]MDU1314757.1 DUF2812 domain-containing protein [Clostridium septicum]QAS61971.1 DUF2812 domain-containing protein [Clostridium septicum]UEC21562.1 DUF2812 domain-containing protein [Clostridium septicum]USS00392.1 DUF2812 domain-containing protein [Clostridium septicum]